MTRTLQGLLGALYTLALLSSVGGRARTDQPVYLAGETGVSTFKNSLRYPLFLPGCAPFVIQRRLDGAWVDLGPPFVCVWEGIAVRLDDNESIDTPFEAPLDTGLYRHRYSVSAGCQPDLPLSRAECQLNDSRSTPPFRVERENCDPSEFGCRFAPAAPNFPCADGIHVGGPSSECTRDPSTGACGYEFIDCP